MPTAKCTKCGAALAAGAKFCVACGQQIDELRLGGGKGSDQDGPSRTPKGDMGQTLFMGSGMSPVKPAQKKVSGPASQPTPHPGQSAAPQPARPSPQPARTSPQPPPGAPASGIANAATVAAPAMRSPSHQGGPDQTANAPRNPKQGPLAHLRSTGTLAGITLNDRYRVEEKIGEGGFGSIYRAKQLNMDRDVALKVLNPAMCADEKLVARFRREARAACNLRDPHTIITFDFDRTSDGLLYIAMELLSGRNLFDILEQEDVIAADRVARILEQCCSSLGEAHDAGVVHRDIKPENIVLEQRAHQPDFVKILDFGIAKIVSGEQSQSAMVLTAAGQTLGTLEYMSPEQLQGKKLDGRSDIYALGMVAYEMLTGNLPFEGDTPAELIRGHLKQLPRPVSEAAPDLGIPKAMDRIIARMLAKDREQRYADVRELRKELQDHIGNVTDPRRVLPTPATADVKQSKVRLWMLLGCVAVVAAGVAGGLLYFFG